MRPSAAFNKHREAIRKLVESGEFLLANPRVFGSALHGTDTPKSDLDLLVDAFPDTTLMDIYGLEEELERLLKVPVHVLTTRGLPEKFKGKILAEACPV